MLDLQKAKEVAEQAAREAGQRIRDGYTEDIAVHIKSDPADRLTQIDLDAQNIIISAITGEFPKHGILGEEDVTKESESGVPFRWVIDPMDGTSNFTQGLPHVGVSIALERDGESILGVLYFPVFDHMYTAINGQGAFRNGVPITVKHVDTMREAIIAEIYSDRVHRGKQITYPPCLAYRKFGSAVTSLAYVSDGRVQGAALKCFRWDIAAASLIIREAGGTVTVEYDDPEDERKPLTCYASCPAIHEEVSEFAKTQFAL